MFFARIEFSSARSNEPLNDVFLIELLCHYVKDADGRWGENRTSRGPYDAPETVNHVQPTTATRITQWFYSIFGLFLEPFFLHIKRV